MRARVALLLAAAVSLTVVIADRRTMAGALAVFAFLAVAPGFALMRALRARDRGLPAWLIAIATSFAVDALVTEAMVYAQIWTAERGCFALVALTVALVLIDRARDRSARAAASHPASPATREVAP